MDVPQATGQDKYPEDYDIQVKCVKFGTNMNVCLEVLDTTKTLGQFSQTCEMCKIWHKHECLSRGPGYY